MQEMITTLGSTREGWHDYLHITDEETEVQRSYLPKITELSGKNSSVDNLASDLAFSITAFSRTLSILYKVANLAQVSLAISHPLRLMDQ